MPKNVSVTFLGTCSGGGPISSRSCSSLAVSLDNELWLVDCAEGTQKQIVKAGLKPTRITKIFVTHLHADHCLGIVPLMCTMMYDPLEKSLDLYGPSGLRLLIRTTLNITQAHLSGRFAVHELLHPGHKPSCSTAPEFLHPNETAGMDVVCDADGQWKMFDRTVKDFQLDAGPIVHRAPCIGYIFTEAPRAEPFSQETFDQLDRNGPALLAQGIRNPRSLLASFKSKPLDPIPLPDGTLLHPPPLSIRGRKLVILGDTSDPSGIISLAAEPSLLVHEATNASVDARGHILHDKADRELVRKKAILRGHSTAEMAGLVAKQLGAQRLYMNHFSTKYPDPHASLIPIPPTETEATRAERAMRRIEDEASEAWGDGHRAIGASDFMVVDIPSHELAL